MKAPTAVGRPFVHDCPNCVWVGWHHVGDVAYNVYFCPDKSNNANDVGDILLRFDDGPGDYVSMPVYRRAEPGNCGYFGVKTPKNHKEAD